MSAIHRNCHTMLVSFSRLHRACRVYIVKGHRASVVQFRGMGRLGDHCRRAPPPYPLTYFPGTVTPCMRLSVDRIEHEACLRTRPFLKRVRSQTPFADLCSLSTTPFQTVIAVQHPFPNGALTQGGVAWLNSSRTQTSLRCADSQPLQLHNVDARGLTVGMHFVSCQHF